MYDVFISLSNKTTGTITKATRITDGTLVENSVYKIGNTVFASARVHSMTAVSTTGSVFQVPEGFRPPGNRFVTGYFWLVSGNSMVPTMFTVRSNGMVDMNYSSNQTTTQVAFSGSWSVI